MKKIIFLFPFLFLLTFVSFAQKNAKKSSGAKKTRTTQTNTANTLVFEEPLYKFGTIKQGTVIKYKFAFQNKGNRPVDVTNATATCGCTVPDYPFISILPNQSGEIGVSFNTAHKLGHQKPIVTVTTTAGTYYVAMEGEVTD